jgi:hypothetical protein
MVTIWLTVMTTFGCTLGTAPTSPSVIPSPSVSRVSTAAPNVWDSWEELAAWVQTGASRGSITLVGVGTDAAIHIDNSSGTALLHGPDLDLQNRRVSLARVRYRWVGRMEGEALYMTMYLRPPVFDAIFHIPRLSHSPGFDLYKSPEEQSGDWVEQDFTDGNHNSSPPPYQVLFSTLQVRSLFTSRPPIHGFVEIDRITLVQ